MLTQVLSLGQSLLITHSGLQLVYGSPKYSGKHVQDPTPFLSVQTAFDPQGEGLQGCGSSSITGCWVQPTKGSPVKPILHWHTGECWTTLQLLFEPQEPWQGSLHFSLIQAKFPGHSVFIVHSGLQLGARPMNSGRQEHTALPFIFLHWEFGPHGDGKHASLGGFGKGFPE